MENNIVQQLETALECPCCYNRPKPDTVSVGMCISGHMTCHPCAEQLIQRVPPKCPICREEKFRVVRGHKLATTVIQIMTAFSLYTCKHLTCNQQVVGSQLSRHEETCGEKPVCCPRHPLCEYKAPVFEFLNGLHGECVSARSPRETQTWNIVFNLRDIYSFDKADVIISNQFKPFVLDGTLEGNFVSHAYVSVTKILGMAVFYIGWLNVKAHVDDQYKHAKFAISVYTNTKHGKVGQFVHKGLVFEGEKINHYEDGVFVSKFTLFNWADWTRSIKCPECFLPKGHPHVHVEIKKL
jgi:hypothetical protein